MLINSKFYLRLLTGLLGATLLLVSILSPWTYFVIFLVILILCLKEYYFILRDNGFRPFSFLGFTISSYLFTLSFLVSAKLVPSTYYISLLTIFPIVCIVFLYIKNLSNSLINLSLSFAGIIYIAIPFSILNLITFKSGSYSYKRISRPGLRKYVDSNNLPRVINGLGIAIMSTSKGVITDKEAKKLNIGGEVLCYVY